MFLAGCMLVAFAVRYSLLPENGVVNGDGMYYTLLGERLVDGDIWNGLSAYWSPVYSFLTGVATLVVERDSAGRWISLLAGVSLVAPSYLLMRDMFGAVAARAGMVLLVFHPFLVLASGWVMTESLYAFVFTTALCVGWRALSSFSSISFAITGILWGVSFLVKPEAIGYAVAMAVLLTGFLWVKSVSFARIGTGLLSFIIGFLVLTFPYVLFLYQKTGDWTISQKIAVNFPAVDFEGELLELSPSGNLTMKDRVWGDDYETGFAMSTPSATSGKASSSRDLISDLSILGSKAATLLRKQIRDYFPALIPIPLALVAVFGFVGGHWSRERLSKEFYLVVFLLSTLLGYAASAVELRYLFPIIPLLIGWVANGVTVLGSILRPAFQRAAGQRWALNAPSLSIFLAVLLLVPVIPLYGIVFKTAAIADVPFEEKAAGLWIATHTAAKSPVVMSAHITPAFYAQASHIYLPDEDVNTVVNYASRRDVDYFVISNRRWKETPYLDPPSIAEHPRLNLVHEVRIDEDHAAYIYALQK